MSNVTQIVGRLLAQGFVDLVTYENKPMWRAVAINAEGRLALGQADAEAASRAEASFEELSHEERAMLEAILRRLRSPNARPVDSGEPRVIVSGSAVRSRPGTVDEAEVAKRTPPDPVEEARKRSEELIARARKQDPNKLPLWGRVIWEFESKGLRAPEQYYEDAEFFKEFAGDDSAGDERSPPEPEPAAHGPPHREDDVLLRMRIGTA